MKSVFRRLAVFGRVFILACVHACMPQNRFLWRLLPGVRPLGPPRGANTPAARLVRNTPAARAARVALRATNAESCAQQTPEGPHGKRCHCDKIASTRTIRNTNSVVADVPGGLVVGGPRAF